MNVAVRCVCQQEIAEGDVADDAIDRSYRSAFRRRSQVDLAILPVQQKPAVDGHGAAGIARELQVGNGQHDGASARPLERCAEIRQVYGLHAARIEQAIHAVEPLERRFEIVGHVGNAQIIEIERLAFRQQRRIDHDAIDIEP